MPEVTLVCKWLQDGDKLPFWKLILCIANGTNLNWILITEPTALEITEKLCNTTNFWVRWQDALMERRWPAVPIQTYYVWQVLSSEWEFHRQVTEAVLRPCRLNPPETMPCYDASANSTVSEAEHCSLQQYDCSRNPCFWGDSWDTNDQNSRPKAESGGGVLGKRQWALSPLARGLGECCKVPQRDLGHSPDRRYILDLLRA